jgi:hypothetical protein
MPQEAGWNFMSDTGLFVFSLAKEEGVSELFGGRIEHNFVLIVDSIKYQLLGFHLESVTR